MPKESEDNVLKHYTARARTQLYFYSFVVASTDAGESEKKK